MARKQTGWKTKGMNRDLSVSAFNPEFAFENMNLRLATNDSNTTLSWVTEKGPREIHLQINMKIWSTRPSTLDFISGRPIGTAVLGDILVLFTTDKVTGSGGEIQYDYIYRLESPIIDDGPSIYIEGMLIYQGYLNFSEKHPLETISSYEAEHIKKVYWTDGINQPRVINIEANRSKLKLWNASNAAIMKRADTFFDFVPSVSKIVEEDGTLSKILPTLNVIKKEVGGLFAPGMIQYCFTYINKYGQQSNIMSVSFPMFTAFNDRGASPEEKTSNSFIITISNANSNFDSVRLYSIQRTSIDAVPIVKVLGTFDITDTIEFTDNGTIGYTIDPTELLYVGGKDITALTMTSKDNTLFMGNITQRDTLVNKIQDYYDGIRDNISITYVKDKAFYLDHTTGIYSHTNTLKNSINEVTTFKGGETYRFGFQLQKDTGEWTEPVFLKDEKNDFYYPDAHVFSDKVLLTTAKITLNFSNIQDVNFDKFIRIRPVVVYPNPTERDVLCQGVLNPTVFNAQDRKNNSPFAQASWYFRPYTFSDKKVGNSAGNPGNINVKQEAISGNPDVGVDNAFANDTYPVYVVVGTTQNMSVIVNQKYLNWTATWNNGVSTTSVSGRSALDGIIYLGEDFGYAFILNSRPVDIGSGTLNFTDLNAYSPSNFNFTPYQLYDGLKVDSNLLYSYEGSDDLPATYTFKFCTAYHCYKVTFTAAREYDYRIVKATNVGTSLAFMHYSSLPTQEEAESEGGVSRKSVEIQGSKNVYQNPYDIGASDVDVSNTQFFIDQSIVTLNSPDIEFDPNVQTASTGNLSLRIVGLVPITSSVSAHSITTASSMLETNGMYDSPRDNMLAFFGRIPKKKTEFGSGELSTNISHKNIDAYASNRLVADYLWNDVVVKKVVPGEETTVYGEEVTTAPSRANYIIHPWHRSGSLNTDSRPTSTASSLLDTKKESNMLFSITSEYLPYVEPVGKASVQIALTENDNVVNYRLQKQREATMSDTSVTTPATSEINYYPNIDRILYNKAGYIPMYDYSGESRDISDIPLQYTPVSMKYKSTSHAVLALKAQDSDVTLLPYGKYYIGSTLKEIGKYIGSGTTFWEDSMSFHQNGINIGMMFQNPSDSPYSYGKFVSLDFLWLGELVRESSPSKFGGTTREAIRNNTWCVAGEAVPLTSESLGSIKLKWTIGDTYYQRYDCLKTYPFTREDPNQLVEILSFMCETRVNIDGRYDRNRGQTDNTNMSPQNFNLLNPVYSQRDNFFTWKKVNNDDVSELVYPNQIYYSQAKTNGADVDLWTNVTLASMLEMDGDKGSVNKLTRFNDSIISFQDTGIAQVLYNENVQISTEQGVPVEIANSGKVQGKRYLSNTIGCSNKWSVVNTPSGIYFIDSSDKSIYLFNGELTNLSIKGGMNSWCKKNITQDVWAPNDSFNGFVSYYDRQNQDVLFINKDTALAWSERLGAFTSFYDYGQIPYLINVADLGIWAKEALKGISRVTLETKLYCHNWGDYCNFFGTKKPYWMTLIGNPEPQKDKIFTNLEFRACVEGDGELDQETGKFTPALPFDSLETWDEYQHGIAQIGIRDGHSAFQHHADNTSGAGATLKRKFRLWRCDVPRDNTPKTADQVSGQNYTLDTALGISRYYRNPMDRMRNPWVYLKLMKNAAAGNDNLPKAEMHDVVITYFD